MLLTSTFVEFILPTVVSETSKEDPMSRKKVWPKAKAKDGAIDAAIEEQGRMRTWVAKQAGMPIQRLYQARGGQLVSVATADAIATVLGKPRESLFDVVNRPGGAS